MIGQVRSLLIVKTSSIGDVIHALPAAQIVKEHYPDIKIGWVVKQKCADLIQGNPWINSAYIIDNKPSAQQLLRLGRELRQASYEVAWDMQGLSLSGLIVQMSGAPRRIGLDLNREGNRWFLTEPVVAARQNRRRHAISILRDFLPTLGIPSDIEWPALCYLAEDTAAAESYLPKSDKLTRSTMVALNIGASSLYKQWPLGSWAGLAARVIGAGFQPVLIGGAQDGSSALAVVEADQGKMRDRILNLAGRTTLRQTAAILSKCAALVTGDTGPMHIAAALRVPTVALFGPTDPIKTGPYGTASVVIKHNDCCTDNHRRPTCNGAVRCMTSISIDEVHCALTTMLQQKAMPRC